MYGNGTYYMVIFIMLFRTTVLINIKSDICLVLVMTYLSKRANQFNVSFLQLVRYYVQNCKPQIL
ncbi:hypothetical protein Hanom_Chr15g01371761 [Helianthus anomalus]